MLNTPTPSPINKCPEYDTKISDGEALPGALGNGEYLFVAITQMSSLTRNISTC